MPAELPFVRTPGLTTTTLFTTRAKYASCDGSSKTSGVTVILAWCCLLSSTGVLGCAGYKG